MSADNLIIAKNQTVWDGKSFTPPRTKDQNKSMRSLPVLIPTKLLASKKFQTPPRELVYYSTEESDDTVQEDMEEDSTIKIKFSSNSMKLPKIENVQDIFRVSFAKKQNLTQNNTFNNFSTGKINPLFGSAI